MTGLPTGAETLARAITAIHAARSAPNPTAGWVAALDALSGADRIEAIEVAAALAVTIGRGELFIVDGLDPPEIPPGAADPMRPTHLMGKP